MVYSMSLSLSALLLAQRALACTSGVMIDDFTLYGDNTNLLSYLNNDDGSMQEIHAESAKLQFTTGEASYFYETLPCQTASSQGYYGLSFNIKAPSGSSVAVELQTMDSCDANEYDASYITVEGLTGETQKVTIAWEEFQGTVNPDAIVGIVWSEFVANTTYELDTVRFECGDIQGTEPAKPEPTP